MAAKKRPSAANNVASKARSAVRAAKRVATSSTVQPISPCLWFDHQAEEAARFYVSVFKKGKIRAITRYPAVGQEIHGRAPGSVMTVEFTLNGLDFTALNGGPLFKVTEAVSLQVLCGSQEEIDYYWDALGAGGDPKAQACGWLKDRYGLSWQIVPTGMEKMYKDHTAPGTKRVFEVLLQMKKLDIAALRSAFKGSGTS